MTGTYTVIMAKLDVTGQVQSDKRTFVFSIPFNTGQPQTFGGHIHSWDKGIMSGTTTWNGHKYGFVANRTATLINMGAPDAPSDLSAHALSATSVKLTWADHSDNETGFLIERKILAGSFEQVGTATANATSYTDNNLSPHTPYIYRIRAVKNHLPSGYSNEAGVTTLYGTITLPPKLIL